MAFDFVPHRCERPAVKESRLASTPTTGVFYCEEHCPELGDSSVVFDYDGPMQCMYTVATVEKVGEPGRKGAE